MNPFEDIEEKITPLVNKATIWLEINKNKKNTFISGLPFNKSEMKEHLKNLKKKHGCNGSLKDITDPKDEEKPSIEALMLQGDHSDNIKEYFNSIGITDIKINTSS